MSMPNSGMTIHTLVLINWQFSLHCNSIQSPVSIVHLRVILTYLIPLLRVYINQHSSNAHSVQFRVQYSAVQFQLVQQCIQISTRINSSMYIVHTSFVSFETPLIYITFSNGLLTNNSTWCQNRGCICISSVRRTYGRIHSSFLHTPMIQSSRQE